MKYIYIAWAVVVFLLVFLKDGLNLDNLTHIGILLLFFVSFVFYRKGSVTQNLKFFFISRAVFFAALVEGFYMISKPVFPSLQFVAGMTLGQMAHNYFIDLLFTLPAYILIFYVILRLINKYEYTVWQFAIIFALGQALGDGIRTFLFNPFLLLLIPYVMINYHAMTVVPFLKIKNALPSGRSKSFWRFILPIVLIPLTYLICGVVIYTLGGILKFN